MSENILKIEKLENGYSVEICDPDVVAENAKPKSTWKDPWKEYAFKNSDEVKNFVGEHLDSLKPPPDAETEYKTEFSRQSEKE